MRKWTTQPEKGEPGRGTYYRLECSAYSTWHYVPVGTKKFRERVKTAKRLYKQLQKETGRKHHTFGTFNLIVHGILKA